MKQRMFMISIFIVLFIATLAIIKSAISNYSVQEYSEPAQVHNELVLKESGPLAYTNKAENYLEMPVKGSRSISDYYDNRAYPGAPPTIPHPLLSEKGIGGKDCLQCHQNGGYVNQFQAYAPITPHVEWLNCKQCHVPQTSLTEFSISNWQKPAPPKLGSKALSSSPLLMPHGLQNRENCLACHAGPAAPEEIRVSHPERLNCRQCHVPIETMEVFKKEISTKEEIGIYQNRLEDTLVNSLRKKQAINISNWIKEK